MISYKCFQAMMSIREECRSLVLSPNFSLSTNQPLNLLVQVVWFHQTDNRGSSMPGNAAEAAGVSIVAMFTHLSVPC